MRLGALAVTVLLSVVALAQQTNPQTGPGTPPAGSGNQRPASTTPQKGRIEGKVSSQAGEPLRRASVTAMRAPSQGEVLSAGNTTRLSAETDAQGNFVLEDLDSGRYSITVQRSGYVSGSQVVQVANGTARVELKLAQGGLIAGRVVDEYGEPFRRARIAVYRKRYANSRWTLAPSQSATTDDDGNFVIGGLPAGKHYLSAEDSQAAGLNSRVMGGRQASPEQPTETYVTTYYPGVIDAASATGFEIAPGTETRGIEIRMKKSRSYSVRGKAVYPSGSAPDSIVSMAPLGGEELSAQAITRAMAQVRASDGSFEFNRVTPGRYAILSLPGSESAGMGRTNVTVTDRDVENVRLEVGPGAEISGRIRVVGASQQEQQGQPAQGNQQARSAQQRLRPSISVTTGDSLPGSVASARAEEDGAFLLKGLGAGRYRVTVGGLPSGMYVKSLRYAGQEQNGMVLEFAGGSGGALDIMVSADGADVSGTVQDANGTAVPRAIVTLWQAGDRPSAATRYFAYLQSDQGGAFRIQSVPPGDYELLAWEEMDGSLLGAPDLLNAFSGSATSVTLGPNGHSTISLKVVPKDVSEKEAAKIR
jgi:hypothetical protein